MCDGPRPTRTFGCMKSPHGRPVDSLLNRLQNAAASAMMGPITTEIDTTPMQ